MIIKKIISLYELLDKYHYKLTQSLDQVDKKAQEDEL